MCNLLNVRWCLNKEAQSYYWSGKRGWTLDAVREAELNSCVMCNPFTFQVNHGVILSARNNLTQQRTPASKTHAHKKYLEMKEHWTIWVRCCHSFLGERKLGICIRYHLSGNLSAQETWCSRPRLRDSDSILWQMYKNYGIFTSLMSLWILLYFT